MIKAGDRIPEHTFLTLQDGEMKSLTTDDVFKGQKVALFAVPGAFTPGCSKTHCPSFVDGADKLKEKGIDKIVCVSVNDCFVMDAWCRAQKATGKILMLADGDATFTAKIGMQKNTGNFGGARSQRYGMIVDDGRVVHVGLDDQRGVIEHSTAAALLAHL
mmetsp:Transcript_9472/g.23697  ORF Transcript_9472/g.23697 Transcript_9472/m.23697 type:complete len:160 (-) Transcript_9472:92-571(-)|eukprot:CAMPEP_0177641008 /NCGR_PEP_ID=MMETSP0447-20121125/6844_1 /TAXON_ID=0 /ORGANISM="Stygamoeba regulata, Strain BSH-02190019" /LENGTH=159 /DNA_ID=CAMNT_0019143111 /DNA_START=50 /DNA_END=529 /DNA_ORIENTATION=-